MEKLLANFVKEISNVAGVKAVYLVNNRGEILFPVSDRPLRPSLSGMSALELVQAMGIFESAQQEIAELEMDFMEGKILVYNNVKLSIQTRLGVSETFMVVLGDKNFNKAHLRLALNVSLAPVVTDKKYKKMDPPVRIRKSSILTRDRLSERDFALAEKVRTLLNQ